MAQIVEEAGLAFSWTTKKWWWREGELWDTGGQWTVSDFSLWTQTKLGCRDWRDQQDHVGTKWFQTKPGCT